jgi:ribosomal protein S18 acetylase RimI-like enzyme
MNPELRLCEHLMRLRPRAFQPEVVHAFVFQDGVVDAVVKCDVCDAHALMRMTDWAPPDFTLRTYALSALRQEDVALYLRNLERGSCQLSRASAELAALVAAAGPVQQIFAVDTRRERILAAGRPPSELAREPGPFPDRLPRGEDAIWFETLGLDKRERSRPQPPELEVAAADLARREDAEAFLALLDAYARDPMGGGAPLPADVKLRLVPDLEGRVLRGDALVLIARRGARPVGLAVCLSSYSTFRARPVLNLHDLAVIPEERGSGVARKLLEAVGDAALARRCCKVTLEVREDNLRAREIYARAGFGDYAAGGQPVRTLFIEKKI